MTRFPAFVASIVTLFCVGGAASMMAISSAKAGTVEVFHADSLAGPMAALKKSFEAKNAGVALKFTPGTSKALAERILKGEVCDVFAPSSPAVIDEDLMGKKAGGASQDAASWYVVFSANEMAVITAKGNPLAIRQVADLAKPEVKFARITAEKDLGTARTVEFLKRAANLEGKPELAQKIIDSATPANSVPDIVRAVREGQANAGVVYLSAAVAAKNDVDIVRFPASVNMSEAIRNAATVTGTAKNPKEAADFVRFVLTPEGQKILEDTGQPPIVPALRKGNVPADIVN
jgi:molybdate transport system substrate-binding protein